MSNINPIFEALSGVDERHVPVTTKKTPGKKMKIALIAAAAAATLTLLVGFTAGAVRGQHRFGFNNGNSVERAFDLDLTSQKFTIPDEYMAKLEFGIYQGSTDTPFGDLMREFDITPLINDNFTYTDISTRVNIYYDNEEYKTVDFLYYLYDKNIGANVSFKAAYFSDTENLTYNGHINLLPGELSDIITLNNGALCMVTNRMAVFSYNGVHYDFELPFESNVPDDYGELHESEQKKILSEIVETMPGIDTVKQVLIDLGIYDPA